MEVLDTPLKYLVKTEYVGPDREHIVARSGDYVVVCAWIQDRIAIAYNLRNYRTGKIPADYLNLEKSWPMPSNDIYVAINNREGEESFRNLRWEVGNHIKVYMWQDALQSMGFGFNLATGKIGAFCTPHRERLKRVDETISSA
jgi:hypothetical protein